MHLSVPLARKRAQRRPGRSMRHSPHRRATVTLLRQRQGPPLRSNSRACHLAAGDTEIVSVVNSPPGDSMPRAADWLRTDREKINH